MALGIHVYFGWVDGDQDWVAGCLTGLLLGLLIGLRQSPPGRVAHWEEGAWGEEMTAAELARLPADEWTVLHDLPNGKWNFDHVVVNDQSVFLINSKWSTNRLLSIDSRGVHMVNRFDEEQTSTDKSVLPQARRDARDLELLIQARTGLQVSVQPVLAWWGQFQAGSTVVNKILIAQGKQLVEQLERHRGPGVQRTAIVSALRPGRRRVNSPSGSASIGSSR